MGGRIGYVRDSRIYYYIGGAKFPSTRMSYLAERNLLLTYYKLFAPKNFARIFLVRVLYLAVRLIVRRRQLLNTFGMIKGVLGFFLSFHRYEAYRRQFIKTKKRDDTYVFRRLLYRRGFERAIIKNFVYGLKEIK